MKNLKNVLHKLSSKPEFKKLNAYYIINRIKKLLPEHLSSSIVFMYVQNDTLIFAMNHQAKRVELEYKKEMILGWLSTIAQLNDKYKFVLKIKKIKAFVIFRTMQKEIPKEQLVYEERATSNFQITTNNDKLSKIFNQIKVLIKKNQGI